VSTDQMVEALRGDLKLRCGDDVIRGAMADIFSPNTELCDMIPRWQSRYRLVLGSNTNEMHFQHYRRQFATMLDCFHGLIVSHEIGVRKPDRVFFDHCVRMAGTRPEECVFVDDMPTNIAGARAAGLHAAQYTDFPSLVADFKRLGVDVPGAGNK
jgi:FMN phosphatase YigB (HAD superfamily)